MASFVSSKRPRVDGVEAKSLAKSATPKKFPDTANGTPSSDSFGVLYVGVQVGIILSYIEFVALGGFINN